MDKLCVLFFSVILLNSCNNEDDTTFSVTPELSTYVESFYKEASLRGVNIPQSNLVAILDSSCQSITEIYKDDEQWILKFDKEMFDVMSAAGEPNNKIEALIFHELGRIILGRELTPGNSIMNGYVKVTGYSDAERGALLDELFQ